MDKPTYQGLKAVFINCTLKKSPKVSHTHGLMRVSMELMEKEGVEVKEFRAVDYEIPPGIYPDMTKEGYATDDWPEIRKAVLDAHILVIGSPIWLGEQSSICRKVIERLYASSSEINDKGQNIYYGRAGGCIITGNEDGIKQCSSSILYALQHLGFTIPPQADAGWVGSVGPGPSYLDEDSGGPESDFTQRNTTFMTWNLMHMAHMLKENEGVPAYGNMPEKWSEGERFDHPNPDYRRT